MTIIFYILVSLCLVLTKTALMPGGFVFDKFYDLLIPIVIYLSLFRSLREGIPVVIFFGLIMDSLCGGPAGLYLATYVWLYAGMRFLSQVLHAGSLILMALAVAIGVAFESIVLLVYMLLLSPSAIVPEDAIRTVILQIVWALITGPLILLIISWAQKKLDVWRARVFPDLLNRDG